MHLDSTYIADLQSGNAHVISHFVDSYASFAYGIIFNILRSKFDTEEATQDTMIKAIRHIHTYNKESSIKSWLYSIAYRTAIDYKRKEKYTHNIDDTFGIAGDSFSDRQVNEKDMKQGIVALLSHLDDEERSIIQLYYLEEMSVKEIAEVTQLTESNVKIKLFRARKTLSLHAENYFEPTNYLNHD